MALGGGSGWTSNAFHGGANAKGRRDAYASRTFGADEDKLKAASLDTVKKLSGKSGWGHQVETGQDKNGKFTKVTYQELGKEYTGDSIGNRYGYYETIDTFESKRYWDYDEKARKYKPRSKLGKIGGIGATRVRISSQRTGAKYKYLPGGLDVKQTKKRNPGVKVGGN